MANVLFTRKNASEIPNVPITDGQLIFDTSGNGKMYLDNGTERLEMGGALTVDATLSKTSTNPVQNKAVAGVMLDTLSDINNATSKGFLADALAIKELNQSLGNIKTWTKKQISENNTVDISNCTEILFDINSNASADYSFIRITGKHANYRSIMFIPYRETVMEIDYSIKGDVLTINYTKNVSAVKIYTK